MAHHASAKKRIRQIERRTEVNRMRILRKVEDAIASGDKDKARTAFQEAQPELMRGANRGVIHRNTVARRLSRMSARIKAMA
ncbi:MAG: 30S ribosomal protein S20 [Rhodospirillales bacterium]|nr:30S ribosomal protein S20 [Rhodospirillales bacterium]